MEETISIRALFEALKKRAWILILTIACGGVVAWVVSSVFLSPSYKSEAQLIVTLPKSDDTNLSEKDSDANAILLNTCKDFITGNAVLSDVKKKLSSEDNYKGSTTDLFQAITVNQSSSSQMFSVVAIGKTPKEAATIANSVADTFAKKVKEFLPIQEVNVISEAVENDKSLSTNKVRNLETGAAIGLILGIGIVFLLEFLDDSIKDSSFLEDSVGLSILGIVPKSKFKKR